MLSETKSLPEKLSWIRTSDFLRRFFLLIRMLCFCFLYLNLTMTVSFFFKRWHVSRSSGFTSRPARDNALQTLLSRTSSPIVAGTGFISSDSRRCYWVLLTAFLSNWTILSLSNWLQFYWQLVLKKGFHIVSENHRNDRSSTLISSSINSSFERFSSWLLVRTIMTYKYRWYSIKLSWIKFKFWV